MLGLPKSTEFYKRIPKQKFYENLNINSILKRCFIDQIKIVYWANKIATSTVNLAAGKNVVEVEVFLVKLNGPDLDETVLKQIDREIPYHIVFILEHNGLYQAWIGYKEKAGSGTAAFKVDRYYHTDWLAEADLPLKMTGLDLDAVYENFVRQVAGDNLQNKPEETLQQSVEREKQIDDIKKRIEKLSAKIRKEKQLNRQMQMRAECKKLQRELEELSNG